MVPLRHVFLKKIKLKVLLEEDKAKLFTTLGKIFKNVAKAYAGGGFDPDLLSDTCEFLAMVSGGSTKGEMLE